MILRGLLILAVGFSASLSHGQAQPCPTGTLADVLATSCTIGNLTFNFSNNFQGFAQTTDLSNNLVTVFFTPDTIAFTPLNTGNQTGFRLTPNWSESPSANSLFFSSHNASFSYTVQTNGLFDILGEDASISATFTPGDTFNINSFDAQCFPNQGCILVAPTINFGGSQPTATATLAFPGLMSNNLHPAGLNFTTALDAFAFTSASATLTSADFLYRVAPQVPTPPLADVEFTNIDLPGVIATFVEAISDNGQIAGVFRDAHGQHGYISDGTTFTPIDFPNAISTFAEGINNRGDVVGAYFDGKRVEHGFLLKDGTFTTIDFPAAIVNFASAINNHGVITGFYETADRRHIHGYTFTEDDGFTTVDHPSQGAIELTEPLAINNRNELAGIFFDAHNNSQGFAFAEDAFQDLLVPGAAQTLAEGLNDSGRTVGAYRDLLFKEHGYFADGSFFRTVDFPGSTATILLDVNSSGRAVGQYTLGGVTHSFLMEKINGDLHQDNRNDPLPPDNACGPFGKVIRAEDEDALTTCNSGN